MIKKTVFRNKQYLGIMLDADQVKRDFLCLRDCKLSRKALQLLESILNNLAITTVEHQNGQIVVIDDDAHNDAAQDLESFTFGNYKKGKS